MLKSDEILIIGKIGSKVSVALSKKHGKVKFIGSQSLLTLSVYKVSFYLKDNSELVKIKDSKFLYSFYPIVKNYEKYKCAISVFKIINEHLPNFFTNEKIYKITLNYLRHLADENEDIMKLYVLWLYKILYSLEEIRHLLYCKGCSIEKIDVYKKGEGGFCNRCLKRGDFEIKPYEYDLIKNFYKVNAKIIKNLQFDVNKFIQIFEDSILNLL